MSFLWPEMLLSLLLLPVLLGLFLRVQRRNELARAELGTLETIEGRAWLRSRMRRNLSLSFMLLGLALLLIGLARPEMMFGVPQVEGTVILAFDVSNSMLADDVEPNRIEAAKVAARSFVENQPSTILIGVVAFGGGGLVVQPPTHERDSILATIDRLEPQGGTSLAQGILTSLNAIAGEAIELQAAIEGGTESFRIEEYSSAVILLLTDGENTEPPEPLDLAQVAAEAGVRIYPIGVGSPEGATLEIEGFNILTQLDEEALKRIASSTNGRYYRAEDEQELQQIYENIDLQLTVRPEMTEITAVLAGFSLLTFLVGGGLSLIWFGRVL